MDRVILIQEVIKKNNFQTYLEIGCEEGVTFLPIKAKYKIAVDPCFQISIKRKLRSIINNPQNIRNRYFEEESDSFFLKRKKYLEKTGQLDVVFVDGLHTFRASLNDVFNSLKYLNRKGIIIMHDCNPSNKPASLPIQTNLEDLKQLEGWTGEWCGDVWKTIIYLRKNLPELLDVCVIDADFGLGIVRLKTTMETKDLSIDEKSFSAIDKMTYEEFTEDRETMLNLKKPEFGFTIIEEVAVNNKK